VKLSDDEIEDAFTRCATFVERYYFHARFTHREVVRTSLPLISSEKHAAQHPEKLR
jgi:hypothetical protein